MDQSKTAQDTGLRRIILTVALANLAYFFFEFAVAKRIGSVSLFADSIDFLEDTAINLLILTALLAKAHRSDASGAVVPLWYGARRSRRERRLCPIADQNSASQRQFDQSGLPICT
jgi:Co/Zn/Cd efflux system component